MVSHQHTYYWTALVAILIASSATAFQVAQQHHHHQHHHQARRSSSSSALLTERTAFPATASTFKRSSSTTTAIFNAFGAFDDFVDSTDASFRAKDNTKYLEKMQQRVDRINAMEQNIEELGDEELQAKTKEFRERLSKGEDINGPLLEEAFAVVREAAWYVGFMI